jgi:DNA end-binding protein Ku
VNLLRWGGEIRSWEELPLPPQGKSAGIKETELKMARHLIEEMSGHWKAGDFRDDFHDAIMKLVEAKAKAGGTATVEPLEEAPPARSADVIDLTELLRRSLRGGAKAAAAPAAKARAHKTPRKRATTAGKAAAKATRSRRAA